jgi:hypothetical protein
MVKGLLQKLRIKPNQIIETIVSTYNPDRTFNAAPMGVIFKKDGSFTIKPFLQTKTYKNLQFWRCCTVNLTTNPEIFFITTFKNSWGLPKKWFKHGKTIKAPSLRIADAFIEAKVRRVKVREKKAEFFCKPTYVELVNSPSYGYCRANFAVIESIIHATRVKPFLLEGKKEEIEWLLKLISHYQNLVSRVAPKSNYEKVMKRLTRILEGTSKQNKTLNLHSLPSN